MERVIHKPNASSISSASSVKCPLSVCLRNKSYAHVPQFSLIQPEGSDFGPEKPTTSRMNSRCPPTAVALD